ncbi:MAG: GUN4 domain-containing protein [Nostocales cyanobacterium 94392]|nr:GUN4 domain-containing protein [Nostocales cyanobacterium 94392]
MANPEEINSVVNRIAAGEYTDGDIAILRDVLSSNDRQLTLQVGKHNVNIGKGQDIQIGDRIYQEWNDDAIHALVCIIRFGESIEPKIREKQEYYQNKIRELNNKTNEKLDQLESRYRDDLFKLETDFQNNLNRIKDEHRNSRDREINRILGDLENRKIRLEQYIDRLEKNWSDANSGWSALEEVNRSYAEQDREYKQNLIKLENEIEAFSQIGASIPSQGPTIPQVDKYFEIQKAELNKNIVYRRKELELNLTKERTKIKTNEADKIQEIEKNKREEIYRLIIQFYLCKEEYPFSENSLRKIKEFQSELKMPKKEIETIEESEIKPYYEKNLREYQGEFTKIITAEHYPVSNSSRKDLKQKQKSLGLKDKDIETVEQPIIYPYYQENLHEYEQEFTQIIKTEGYPVSHTARTQLEQKQKLLGLKDRDVKDSEQKISEPYYRENLHKYEQEFIDLIKEEVTELTKEYLDKLKSKQNRLKDRQKSLCLKSEDIKDSEQQIIKQYYQKSLDKYEREFTQLINNQGYYLDDKIKNNLIQRQQLLGIKILGFNSEDIVIVQRTIKNCQEKDTVIDYLSSNLFKEDYQKLRNSLASTKWKDANEETKNILFRLAKNRNQEHNQQDIKKITEEQIKTINLLQIRIIDLLWDIYSKGRFGFHKQRDIFITAGKDYKAFSENIAWKKRSFFLFDFLSWKSDDDIVFNIDAPEGHLPFWRPFVINPEQFLIYLDSSL